MKFMDNFIYIIVGIIWVVYSLYTNKQKQQKKQQMEAQRKNQPPPVAGPQKPRSLLEQLLDPESELSAPATVDYDEYEDTMDPTFAEFSEDQPYVPLYQSSEVVREEVPTDYFESQYETRGEVNYYDNRETLVASHDEVPILEELIEEFDLRKAVIYSEILNPKYI